MKEMKIVNVKTESLQIVYEKVAITYAQPCDIVVILYNLYIFMHVHKLAQKMSNIVSNYRKYINALRGFNFTSSEVLTRINSRPLN